MANLYGVSAYQQTNSTWNNTRTNNTKTDRKNAEKTDVQKTETDSVNNDLQPSRYDEFSCPYNEERIWDGDWRCGAV